MAANFLYSVVQLQWWVYVVVVLTFFSVALVLNYIVKKINESRLDDRCDRLQNKAAINRAALIQRQFEPSFPARTPLEVVIEQSNPPTVNGISLVFDKTKEDERKKDQIDITHFPDSKAMASGGGSTSKEKTENVLESKQSDNSKEQNKQVSISKIEPKQDNLEFKDDNHKPQLHDIIPKVNERETKTDDVKSYFDNAGSELDIVTSKADDAKAKADNEKSQLDKAVAHLSESKAKPDNFEFELCNVTYKVDELKYNTKSKLDSMALTLYSSPKPHCTETYHGGLIGPLLGTIYNELNKIDDTFSHNIDNEKSLKKQENKSSSSTNIYNIKNEDISLVSINLEKNEVLCSSPECNMELKK